ncbi:hypothetical protein BH24CHL8_BH24CHL8_01770 [soil metagenome]
MVGHDRPVVVPDGSVAEGSPADHPVTAGPGAATVDSPPRAGVPFPSALGREEPSILDNRSRSRRYAAVAVRADGRRVPMPLPEPATLLERLVESMQRIRERFDPSAR